MNSEAPSNQVPQRSTFLRRKKVLLVGLLLFVSFGYLGYTSFSGSTPYYLTPGELKAKGDAIYGQNLRVSGKVAQSDIEWNAKTLVLKFTVTDDSGSLPVVYTGVVPDAFKAGEDVVAEGSLSTAGVFQASKLLVKCPSKYEPEG